MQDYLSSPTSPSSPFDASKGRNSSKWGALKETAAAIRAVEGKVGFAERAAIFERNILTVVAILCIALYNQWALSSVGWGFAGALMLVLVAVMAVVAAIGTLLYPQARWEIPKELKSTLWSKMLLPASAMATLVKVIAAVTASSSALPPSVENLASIALPIGQLVICVSVAAVFVQWVFNNHGMSRSKLSTKEMGQIITRQDGLQH